MKKNPDSPVNSLHSGRSGSWFLCIPSEISFLEWMNYKLTIDALKIYFEVG
jgi:hypothetical protein